MSYSLHCHFLRVPAAAVQAGWCGAESPGAGKGLSTLPLHHAHSAGSRVLPLIIQVLPPVVLECKRRKFGFGAKVCLLLEKNFLLLGAPLSAGRFAGRKRVGYLFLQSEGNGLD